eukprot:8832665-Alexandrium_andersonii.AAC.1
MCIRDRDRSTPAPAARQDQSRPAAHAGPRRGGSAGPSPGKDRQGRESRPRWRHGGTGLLPACDRARAAIAR